MKLVFASDSFKGTLSSAQICTLLGRAASEVLPDAECVPVPLADGGEGTLEAIRSVRQGEEISLYVFDGLGRATRRKLFVSGDEAFIETAAICGLAQLSDAERNPMLATSNGVGAFISHALFHGCTRIVIGLGGTCTNDGGMGCLRALGFRFFDADGCELSGSGADLARVASIDETGVFPQVRDAQYLLLSDVANPLLGANGATHVFARQKGADDAVIDRLERGMRNFAEVIAQVRPGVDFDTPGYGAAGGLGMALSVFLGAKTVSGIDALLDMLGFDALVADADLVVIGEGQLDEQSLQGKALCGVAARAKRVGVPVAAICGKVALSDVQVEGLGLAHVVDASYGQPVDQAMAHAEENYLRAARELFGRIACNR